MKTFLKNYGFVIVSALVVITLVITTSPIGNSIKTETSNLINSFGVVSKVKMDQLDYDLWAAGKDDLTLQILGRDHVQYLYDVGEDNLTADDIVRVGDVDCYVLKVSPDKTKAKLITKEIYDIRWDDGGHTSEETEGHLGFANGWETHTYDYKYSTSRKWMNDTFYINYLKSDNRIIKQGDILYNPDIYSGYNNKSTFYSGDYVMALEYFEAHENYGVFKWDSSSYWKGFYLNSGFLHNSGSCDGYRAEYDGTLNNHYWHMYIGTRPVFWISLE